MVSLIRSRTSDEYHLPNCRHAPGGLPWDWATDKSLGEVLLKTRRKPGMVQPCDACLPVAPHKDGAA